MSTRAYKAIPPIPHSNDDMLLLSKTSILNPLIELDSQWNDNNDLNQKCDDFKMEVRTMFNDNICNLIKPKSKKVPNRNVVKHIQKTRKKERSLSIGKNITMDILNGLKCAFNRPRKEINKTKQYNNKNTLMKQNMLTGSMTTNQSMRNIMKSNKEAFKQNLSSFIFFNSKQGRNHIKNANNNQSYKDKENTTTNRSNINYKGKNIHCQKNHRTLYSCIETNEKNKNNYMNYILSSPKKRKNNRHYKKDSLTLDNIPLPHKKQALTSNHFSSESLLYLKDVVNRNRSLFHNSTASTNAGLTMNKYSSKRPSFTSNSSMDKLRASLSEASSKLVSELCQMNREHYDSHKESKVKTLDMLDKENDLGSVLDIKVDFLNKRNIGNELNKRLKSKEEIEYRKAVIEFSKNVRNFNPESTLKLADTIRDNYFKKTNSGKYEKNSLSRESHKTEMKRLKSKLNINQSHLTKIWSQYERIKEKMFPTKNDKLN